MAIGSDGEIGVRFGLWKDMSEIERLSWWEHMRTEWQPYLLRGYATLVHDTTNNPIYSKENNE